LPSTTGDMPSEATLFSVTPGKNPVITRLISRQTQSGLAELVNHFELSPDETRMIVPGTNNRVTVLTLATGEVTEIHPEEVKSDLMIIPKWRNSEEICFAVTQQDKDNSKVSAKVYLWSKTTGSRLISDSWTDVFSASPDQPSTKTATQ